MNETTMDITIIKPFPDKEKRNIDIMLDEAVKHSGKKIIVLDDDPTGIQTVHDVSVYTDWSMESIQEGFAEENNLFFILTNSRSFTETKTTQVHKDIAQKVAQIAKKEGRDYLIVCRGDSTLRGHYPLETEVLKKQIELTAEVNIDAEILCPYFNEGGRFTLDDIHYVKSDNKLIPAGLTEFAKDQTFGYVSSDLKDYVVEKTKGKYQRSDCVSISNELLHGARIDEIEKLLENTSGFKKIIVNATDNYDVKVFAIAFYRAMGKGKHFLVRAAAALVKALGNIDDIALLTREEMVQRERMNGGLIMVGSHTAKTTAQVKELMQLENIVFLEMNSDLVLQPDVLEEEINRIVDLEERHIRNGETVCVFTKRKLLVVENDTPEQALIRSVAISNALQECVKRMNTCPAFVIAKGGITSSDIGVKALRVRKAEALGQVWPGIPVWRTDRGSKFPDIPYIIFPGNVGEVDSLRKTVEILKK